MRLRSGSSLAAGLLHSAFGAGAMIAAGPVRGGSSLCVGLGSFSSTVPLLAANLGLFLHHRLRARRAA